MLQRHNITLIIPLPFQCIPLARYQGVLGGNRLANGSHDKIILVVIVPFSLLEALTAVVTGMVVPTENVDPLSLYKLGCKKVFTNALNHNLFPVLCKCGNGDFCNDVWLDRHRITSMKSMYHWPRLIFVQHYLTCNVALRPKWVVTSWKFYLQWWWIHHCGYEKNGVGGHTFEIGYFLTRRFENTSPLRCNISSLLLVWMVSISCWKHDMS